VVPRWWQRHNPLDRELVRNNPLLARQFFSPPFANDAFRRPSRPGDGGVLRPHQFRRGDLRHTVSILRARFSTIRRRLRVGEFIADEVHLRRVFIRGRH